MNLFFIFIQLIGVVAWLLLVVSYYRKSINKILSFQIISTILYCLHYYLLGAYSGLFICIFEVIMDYGYYKTDWDDKLFKISIPFYMIVGIFSYHTFLDLFSIFASLTDRYSLSKERRVAIIGGIVAYILWIIYDLHALSISGVITDSILVLSNISIIIRELKAQKKKLL